MDANVHDRRTFRTRSRDHGAPAGPGGCPWDREQTFDSIKPYTLEETYEVLEAIDNRDWEELPGELGDLLLQVLFYSEMAKEQGTFSIDDVLDRLSRKLVDRHPHVFGDAKADTSAEDVKRNWEALKVEERKKRLAHSRARRADARLRIDSGQHLFCRCRLCWKPINSVRARRRLVLTGRTWKVCSTKLSEETAELRQHLQEFPAPGPRPKAAALPVLGVRRFPKTCGCAWKKKSAIFSLCWSTLPAISRSIRNPRCAKPIANSAGAFSGWSSGCTRAAKLLKGLRWMNSNRSWQQAKQQEKLVKPGCDCDSPLRRAG